MSDAKTTSNPFARVVLFYYTYLRLKLTPSDLEKIAKKYSTKPDKLLTDLGQKYSFIIPEYVYINEIHRLCSIFKVPECYTRLVPELPTETEYDSHCDVYSPDFDPLMSLQSGQISISYLKAPTLDNLTKVFSILPDYLPNPKLPSIPAGTPATPSTNTTFSSSATDSQHSSESVVPKSKHLFDMIAEASLLGKARRNGPEESSADASPLALLHQYMKKHVRVRIILRRNNSVRGSLDAYILAFDRHYNMLLSDVDEEYITNSQKKRAMAMGRFRSQNNVLHRHLPQLILRGDLVVMVFRKPS